MQKLSTTLSPLIGWVSHPVQMPPLVPGEPPDINDLPFSTDVAIPVQYPAVAELADFHA
jgi:hypothetical protein